MKKENSVFNSASRIVFIVVAITVCATFAGGILTEDTFKMLAGFAFTYYFTRDRGNTTSQ